MRIAGHLSEGSVIGANLLHSFFFFTVESPLLPGCTQPVNARLLQF